LPRDILARATAILRGEGKKAKDEIIWGSSSSRRRYEKRQQHATEERGDVTRLAHHNQRNSKAGAGVQGRTRHSTVRAVSVADALRVLKQRHKTVSGVARALGVSRSTVDGWYRGVKPRPASRAMILRAAG
jgi:transposase-like protein